MKKTDEPFSDPLIDEVRATRRRLVREHDGLAGWVAHLRQEQEKHRDKLVAPRAWKARG